MTNRREGLLVPPSQPDALASALLHMLADRQLQECSAKAGLMSAKKYAWIDVSERVIDVYERAQILANPSPRMVMFGSPLALLPSTTLMSSSAAMMLPLSHLRVGASELVSDATEGVPAMLTEPFEARVRALTQRVVGRALGRSRITPNMLTILGLILTLSVTIALATGHLILGGVLVLVTSVFDMFDGALARATDRHSTFGAFFDSTIDRYSEAFIFLGLLLYYQRFPATQLEVSFVYLAIIGSLMVSYTRARAEALGLDCKVGILARPERIILLSIGLIIGWLDFTLAILALFTNLTAFQRIYHVWLQTEGAQRREPNVAKPTRRSWFASRDQSPS
jgi:CDP-diacylglycerol--glycerol-3-phosphate 3-phosphatidyltransferase